MNHYTTLGVPKDADADTIKKAYRSKAAKAHPDRRGGSHQAMVALTRAHETLSDADKRARYDETGEDGPQGPSIDQLANQVLCSLFMQLIEKVPEQTDHVAEATRALVENIASIRQLIEKLDAQAAVINRRIKLLKFKGKGRNVIRDFLEARLTQIPQQKKGAEQQVQVLQRAVEILKQYDWTQVAAPATSGYTVFLSTWSR